MYLLYLTVFFLVSCDTNYIWKEECLGNLKNYQESGINIYNKTYVSISACWELHPPFCFYFLLYILHCLSFGLFSSSHSVTAASAPWALRKFLSGKFSSPICKWPARYLHKKILIMSQHDTALTGHQRWWLHDIF